MTLRVSDYDHLEAAAHSRGGERVVSGGLALCVLLVFRWRRHEHVPFAANLHILGCSLLGSM